jgi:uncharacterized protein YpuA (DUF1002 family)
MTTSLNDILVTKLKKMLGETKATELVDEVLTKLGKRQVDTPDELKKVADELISRGGLTKMIGHSIMTEALLRGARAG